MDAIIFQVLSYRSAVNDLDRISCLVILSFWKIRMAGYPDKVMIG